MCGDDGAVGVTGDDDTWEGVGVEEGEDGVEEGRARERGWGNAHADGEVLDCDDSDVRVTGSELTEEGDVGVKTDLGKHQRWCL